MKRPDKYEQKRLRQEYRWLYKKLLNLFAAYDPLSLCAMGAPLDEYGGEVIRILSKIQDIYSSAALREAMFEVFACNFPNKFMQGFPKERFDVMAQEFWRAYRRWQEEEERVRRTARFYFAGSFGEREYWLARELYKVLGYDEWRNFEKVIAKAKVAVKFNGFDIDLNFVEINKIAKIGSRGGKRPIRDVELSRYACYIIVQNSDGSKPIVALAQGYFAVQTRRQELADADTFAALSEDEKRLIYREHLRLYNRKLHQTAHHAGVHSSEEHATFSDAGYKGLYAGLTENDIHSLKELAPDEEISDWMDSEELGANIFRATQTDAAMRRNKIKGRENAYQTHFTIGRKVRDFIIHELGGTPPELIAKPEKGIDQLRTEEAYQLKHRNQPSLFESDQGEEHS